MPRTRGTQKKETRALDERYNELDRINQYICNQYHLWFDTPIGQPKRGWNPERKGSVYQFNSVNGFKSTGVPNSGISIDAFRGRCKRMVDGRLLVMLRHSWSVKRRILFFNLKQKKIYLTKNIGS